MSLNGEYPCLDCMMQRLYVTPPASFISNATKGEEKKGLDFAEVTGYWDRSSSSIGAISGSTNSDPKVRNTRAAAYTGGRKPYPEEMFKKIRDFIGCKPWVLEVGCGPGRATIPLRRTCGRRIIGFDSDQEMLQELALNSLDEHKKIHTVQGKVSELPKHFPRKLFDAVCAFSAFTLFCDDASIRAIRSVLKPDGVFIDAGDQVDDKGATVDKMGAIMRKVIEKAGLTLQPAPVHNVKEALERNGFELLATHECHPQKESYNFKQALANFKSRDAYQKKFNDDQRQRIATALADYFSTEAPKGSIHFEVTYKLNVYRLKKQVQQEKIRSRL
jgi:SAM-dependent methyltransferase